MTVCQKIVNWIKKIFQSWKTKPLISVDWLKKNIDTIDKNKDGYLSFDELKQAIKEYCKE